MFCSRLNLAVLAQQFDHQGDGTLVIVLEHWIVRIGLHVGLEQRPLVGGQIRGALVHCIVIGATSGHHFILLQ